MISNQLAAKCEVLTSLKDDVENLVADHIKNRGTLWMPANVVCPPDMDMHERINELGRAAAEVPPAVRAIYALNLLTERGLPSYFHLLEEYLGLVDIFESWTGRWTAEEDRHGDLLYDLARLSGLIAHMGALQEMQFSYLQAGFRPPWGGDPYCALGYTAVQEEMTRVAHNHTAQKLRDSAGRILAGPVWRVAGEEARHAHFYAEVVGLIFHIDPDEMLVSLLNALLTFYMPGKTVPSFEALEDVARRTGILGPSHLALVIERLLIRWEVPTLRPRTSEGAAAKRKLLRLPSFLKAWDAMLKREEGSRTFTFPFLTKSFTL